MQSLFGGSGKVNKTSTRAAELRVQTALAGKPRPIGWGQGRVPGNLIGYYNFKTNTQKQGGKGSVAGGGGKGGSSATTYTADMVIGLCEGPVSSIIQAWNGSSPQSLSSLNLTAALGTYTATPDGFLTTNIPASAFAYRGLARVSAYPMQLGQSNAMPNLNYEVKFAINSAWAGVPDANPAAIIPDAFTNVYYGLNIPAANIGDLTTFSNYCIATGLAISPVLTGQRAANTTIQEWLSACNCEGFFSGGVFNVTPYGDAAITANGATYTPPAAPEFDFDDATLLPIQETGSFPSAGGGSPGDRIKIARADPTKLPNTVSVGFLDRSTGYNPDTVQAQDDASVAENGTRGDATVQCDFFNLRSAAQMSAHLQLGRKQVRRMFMFTVGRRFIVLDPMNIVTLSSVPQGLSRQWVRIKEITENQDKTLTMIAEEYLAGTGAAPAYGAESNGGYSVDYNAAPGNALAPVTFDAPNELASTLGLETFVATGSAAVAWGGCELWLSTDGGTTYYYYDKTNGPARMGVLSATFASGSDPDTVNTLAVDLTQSNGALAGGTQNDADTGVTLCYVGGEYVAYQQATLTAANKYNLGKSGATAGYLRRGMYGSTIASHAAAARFVRIDENVFRIPYTKDDIGKTIYIKLLSFNTYGGGQQGLADVTGYAHTIGGPPVNYGPSGLTVTPALKALMLKWTNPPNVGVVATEIWRSATSSFAAAVHINDASAYATHYIDGAVTVGATYWYWIRTRDKANNPGNYYPLTSVAGVSGTPAAAGSGDVGPGAVTTGPGGNLGGSIDPSGYPIIDFSYNGHFYKILDWIGDGTTYYRMPAANMDVNRRGLIDFTQAHLNKNLDNVAAGTTNLHWTANQQRVIARAGGSVNQILDPNVTSSDFWGASSVVNGNGTFTITAAASGASGANNLDGHGSVVGVPCKPGDWVYSSYTLAAANTGTAYAYAYIRFYNSAGAMISQSAAPYSTSGTRTNLQQAPAGTVSTTLYFYVSGGASGGSATYTLPVFQVGASAAASSGAGLDVLADGTSYGRTKLTSLTSGNVDLGLAGVVGRNLTNIADATGRYAVTNGASLKGVASVDASNLGIVDLAQAHLNKNLDNLAAGTTNLHWTAAQQQVTLAQRSAANVVIDPVIKNQAFWSSGAGIALNGDGTMTLSPAASTNSTSFGQDGAGSLYSPSIWPGDLVSVQFTVSAITGTANAYLNLEWLDKNGNVLSYKVGPAATAAGTYRHYGTAPANAVAFAYYFQSQGGASGGTAKVTAPIIRVGAQAAADSGVGLDVLADGSTWGRTSLTWLSAGAPKIDFGSGIHLNKNADNIAAGVTWSPIKLTSLTSGNVDLGLAGVVGRNLTNIADTATRFAAVEANANNTETRTSALTASLSNQTQDGLADGTTYARARAAYLKSGRPYCYQGAYSAPTTYNQGDEVLSGGNYYVYINATASAGNTPPNVTYWQLVGPASLDSLPDGSTFARVNAAALTSGNIDLSKSGVTNKHLGNIADATGRYAVTNGASLKGVASVDASNLGIVDLAQAHLNKNADQLADGTTNLFLGANKVSTAHVQPGAIKDSCFIFQANNLSATPVVGTWYDLGQFTTATYQDAGTNGFWDITHIGTTLGTDTSRVRLTYLLDVGTTDTGKNALFEVQVVRTVAGQTDLVIDGPLTQKGIADSSGAALRVVLVFWDPAPVPSKTNKYRIQARQKESARGSLNYMVTALCETYKK